jgi:protein-tyrosine phosphatase
MYKIMFVCHGNICRSPMAEFVFRNLVSKKGLTEVFDIASSATSTEEIGNAVHPGTRTKLLEHGITTGDKRAVQFKKTDYTNYDFIIAMDQRNINNILRIIGEDLDKKVIRLLDLITQPRDIADPWYTGDFDLTYADIYEGCLALLSFVLNHTSI